jgi:hypothetical protein
VKEAVMAATEAPRPLPRSSIAFSQVIPRLDPKYVRLGRANAAGTGTTNPHLVGRGDQAAAPRLGERQACRATSGAFAAARISGRT